MITAKRSEHFSLFVALMQSVPLKGDETVTSVNNFKFMSTSGRISTYYLSLEGVKVAGEALVANTIPSTVCFQGTNNCSWEK